MKHFFTIISFLLFTINAIGQKALRETASEKEPIAVAELGGATSWNFRNGGFSLGPSAAIEVTPIENWLELELGITQTFGTNLRELDIDLLLKKPWTLSQKVEFMVGVGAVWTHESDYSVPKNSVGGEIVLDFMFWPLSKHRFGWYLEPEYEYNFGQGHEQSVGISCGLLIGIP